MRGSSQQGFGVAAGLAIVVVLALAGGGGWYVWRMNHKPAAADNQSEKAATPVATSTKPAADPYAGWKQYCDSAKTACFRYPGTWQAPHQLNGDGNLASAQDPNAAVNVSLDATEVMEGLGEFVTTSVQSLAGTSKYSVVGGYYTINNLPSYWVVDNAIVNESKLQKGQHAQFKTKALTFSKNGKQYMFYAAMNMNSGEPTAPLAQATAWPASTDGQVAANIAGSFSLQ